MPGSLDQTESVYEQMLKKNGLTKKPEVRGFYATNRDLRKTQNGWQAKRTREKALDAQIQETKSKDAEKQV